jgi:hypothetical protein
LGKAQSRFVRPMRQRMVQLLIRAGAIHSSDHRQVFTQISITEGS